jgi:hypothetical protein
MEDGAVFVGRSRRLSTALFPCGPVHFSTIPLRPGIEPGPADQFIIGLISAKSPSGHSNRNLSPFRDQIKDGPASDVRDRWDFELLVRSPNFVKQISYVIGNRLVCFTQARRC